MFFIRYDYKDGSMMGERERKQRLRRRETCTDVVVVGAISSSSPSQ
jgi:hypothetical protein